MTSMTGYAYNECEIEGTQISVEFKGLNSRFLDLNVNIPYFLNPLEMEIRKAIQKKISRGKVDLTIRVRDNSSDTKIFADVNAAKSYHAALCEIARAVGKDEGEITISTLAHLEGVLQFSREYDAENYRKKVSGIFEKTLDEFVQSRESEGANLKADLLSQLSVLEKSAAFFKEWQPQMEGKFREGITARFKELLQDSIDENKIMAEVASMMIRYTINEEIVRLQSHIETLRKEFEKPCSGKRIDFICQEAAREVNTIGSKNQFVEVGREVVNAKDALENIREQAKNVE